VKCPFCNGKLKKQKSPIPPFLDPVRIVSKHPMPILRRFLVRTAESEVEVVKENMETHICEGCSFIALFDLSAKKHK